MKIDDHKISDKFQGVEGGKMKKTIAIAICLFVAAAAIFVGGKAIAKVSRHSVESRITAILKKKPHLKEAAKISGGKLRILVFKNERRVEVHAPGWKNSS